MSIIKLPLKKDYSEFQGLIENYRGANCVFDYESKFEKVEYESCNLILKKVRDKSHKPFFAIEIGNIFLAKVIEDLFIQSFRSVVKGLESLNSMSLKDVDIYMIHTEVGDDKVPVAALCLNEEYFLPHLNNYSGKYVSGLKLAILVSYESYQSILHQFFDCLTDEETRVLKGYCDELYHLAVLVDPENDLELH